MREKPMAHQRKSLKHAKTTPLVIDTSDAGTGKTAVRILAFAERRRKGGKCLLVLCPRTLLSTAWESDFSKFAPDMKVSVATAANREKAFAVEADAYITNHDAAKWLAKQKKAFFERFDEVVIDESTAFKHHTSQRSKAIEKVLNRTAAKYFTRRSILTATIDANGLTDVWHQVYLLDGGRTLGPSFYGFRNSICVPEQKHMGSNFINWIDRPGASEAVFGLLQKYVIRHKREECVDLPDNHVYHVDYTLPKTQKVTYDKLEESQLIILIEDLVRHRLTGKKPVKITAINAAALATKLSQVASGAVYTSDANFRVIDTGRYELILDLAEAVKHSFVLYLWNHQKEQLIKEAEKRKLKYCVLDGSTSDRDRKELVAQYQAGLYNVMFAHPKTAGHGLTLTRGTRTIWASPTFNAEWWIQASARQHRIGQKQKTETIVVLGKGTIDEKIYHEILTPKEKKMKTLQELFESMAEYY